jgi:CheY-like chemotaxis protein
MSILIVEDDPICQTLVRRQLQYFGLASDAACSGLTALGRVRQTRYELILLDLNLPDINGIETARLIRQHEAKVGRVPSPIMALTAEGDWHACFAAGMDGFVPKPMLLLDLARLLSQHGLISSERTAACEEHESDRFVEAAIIARRFASTIWVHRPQISDKQETPAPASNPDSSI